MPRRLVLFIFLISGASGLIYEVVWMRMITNVVGSSVYAVTTVLVAFLGGLAIGGALIGRIVDRGWNGLLLYAALEFGLAAYAVLLPGALGVAEGVYIGLASASGGPAPLTFRLLLSLALLLPPTILMGGTLPALGKSLVRSGDTAGADIGGLYWTNTIGAAMGAFAAGFVLIRTLGMTSTIALAAAGNAWAGIAALIVGRRFGAGPLAAGPGDLEAPPAAPSPRPAGAWLILPAIGISGFTTLAYEVLWTRLLSTIFVNTTYSFATMLTVFLIGIAVGSFLTSWLVDRWRVLLLLFGLAESAVGILVLASLGVFSRAGVIGDAVLSVSGLSGLRAGVAAEFFVSVGVMLPATVLLGAVFPIAVKLYVGRRERAGTATGTLVAANTVGAVLGSLVAGFLLIPLLGTRVSTMAVAGLNLGLGLVLLSAERAVSRPMRARWGAAVVLASLAALTLVPQDIRAWRSSNEKELLYYREGVSAAVSVVVDQDGSRRMKLNNHYPLGGGEGLPIERRMGHIAVLLHPNPRRVALIGLGTGDTTGAMTLHPTIERLDALEISPEVVEAARLFSRENHRLHENPRVKIVVDDARHYLKLARDPYDLIVADLFLPWQAGEGNLYTLEHYRLARQKLAPEGIYVQWLPLYQLSVRQLGTIVATFRAAFPHTSMWLGALRTSTPIAALVGSGQRLQVDPEALEARLARRGALGAELQSILLDDVEAVVSLFVAAGDDLNPLTRGVPLNTYNEPTIEFSAPADLYRRETLRRETLAALLTLRRFPRRALLPGVDALRLATFERHYHATTALLKGVLRAYVGDASGERAAFLRALERTPRHRYLNEVLVTMAAELIQRGQLDAAVELCRKVVQINPLNYEAASNLSAALRLLGRYPDAIAAAKAAIALNGRFELAYMNLGLAYAEAGQRPQALEVFRQVLKINPGNSTAARIVKELEGR